MKSDINIDINLRKINLEEGLFPKIFSYISLFLFIGVLAFYMYMILSEMQISKKIEETRTRINSIVAFSEKDRLQAAFHLERKVNDYKDVLKSKNTIGDVLKFIESKTLNFVYFDSLQINVENNTLTLTGTFPSVYIVDQQLLIFSEDEKVEKTTLKNISLTAEGVEAELEIKLKENIFKDNLWQEGS